MRIVISMENALILVKFPRMCTAVCGCKWGIEGLQNSVQYKWNSIRTLLMLTQLRFLYKRYKLCSTTNKEKKRAIR